MTARRFVRRSFSAWVMALAVGGVCVAADKPPAVFVYGTEPIYVPSEMQPVTKFWRPLDQKDEPGIKRGPAFKASLVRVFCEDTAWTSEMAVFRFPDGVVRAWKTASFVPEDRDVMRLMKTRSKKPPVDRRQWVTKWDDETNKLLAAGKLNRMDTRHFSFVWGNDPDDASKNMLKKPAFMKKAGDWFEKVWAVYEADFNAPMPHAADPTPQRILVRVYNTGVPSALKGYANSATEMALNPVAMDYGSTVVGHEFGHVVQAYTGGFMVRPSGGPWWETHAEFNSFNLTPTQGDTLGEMLGNLTNGFQWPDSRYANWAILMHLWEKKRTQNLVFAPWTQNKRDDHGTSLEDPLETTVRIGQTNGSLPKGLDSLNDEVGEMAARLVTMDYVNQGYLAGATVELRRKTFSRVMPSQSDTGWFDAPVDRKLYAFGIQWVVIKPDAGAREISVDFRGRSKDAAAAWRLTLVGIDANNVARYSSRVTATAATAATVKMAVRAGESYVLAVAATPSTYRSLTWNQTPDFDYPYVIRPVNASVALPPTPPAK